MVGLVVVVVGVGGGGGGGALLLVRTTAHHGALGLLRHTRRNVDLVAPFSSSQERPLDRAVGRLLGEQ